MPGVSALGSRCRVGGISHPTSGFEAIHGLVRHSRSRWRPQGRSASESVPPNFWIDLQKNGDSSPSISGTARTSHGTSCGQSGQPKSCVLWSEGSGDVSRCVQHYGQVFGRVDLHVARRGGERRVPSDRPLRPVAVRRTCSPNSLCRRPCADMRVRAELTSARHDRITDRGNHGMEAEAGR